MTPDYLADVKWVELPSQPVGEIPHVTHEGVFDLLDMRIRCYRLSDGRAIVNADDVHAVFGDVLEALK